MVFQPRNWHLNSLPLLSSQPAMFNLNTSFKEELSQEPQIFI